MQAPESIVRTEEARPGRQYRIVFWDEDFDDADTIAEVAQYIGERRDGHWRVWDEGGVTIDGDHPDSNICILAQA